MRELKFEELTLEQKLGMVYTAYRSPWFDHGRKECEEWILSMVKKRALGSVWVQQNLPDSDAFIQQVKETADYPILIFTDAESGMGEYNIGKHNAIGCTDSVEHAYAFGKTLGVTARKKGYNVVCNPVVDLSISGSQRSLGADKEKVALLAAAVVRGMHDGGILSVCKHYPGDALVSLSESRDSHMEEVINPETKEELLETNLYPYIKLNEQGLLDGLMVGHHRFPNIDPDHPASLSKTIIDIIREQGFEGFTITDALCMQGVVSSYGWEKPMGLCIGAGNTFALPYSSAVEIKYNQMKMGYENGYFTEEQLDAAVKIVLETQKKAMEMYKETEISEQEHKLAKAINKDSVYAKTDAGVLPSISRDGKYLFVMVISNVAAIDGQGKVEVDTFSGGWYRPKEVSEKIRTLFPNSDVYMIHEFPSQGQNHYVINHSLDYDDTIFLNYSEPLAYVGVEAVTCRLQALFRALQQSNRVSTLVHFGNPCVLEPLPHFPRVIIGGNSTESIDTCIEVLAGNYPAKGKLTYDVKLK